MENKFVSQAGQDKWVVDTLNNIKGGYFLDIGAYDGLNISNTYYLEKELDWDGLCIEADPSNFKKLTNVRDCGCINVAVADIDGVVNFKQNDAGGHVTNSGGFEVQSRTIKTILKDNDCPKIIDYISLDIEGYELIVLENFPFDEYEFKLLTLEHNLYLGDATHKNKMKEILINNGYVLVKENVENIGDDPFEDWYINPKHIKE